MGHSRVAIHTELDQNEELAVCFALVASVFADEEMAAEAPKAVLPAALPFNYYGLPYAYHHAAPVTYTLPAPIQYKYVPKEVEIEVKSFQPEVVATGCVNAFGNPVPCAQRKRREAEETAEEAAPAAPAAPKLEVPYYYGGYPAVYGAAPLVHSAPLVHTAPVAYSAPLAYHHVVAPVTYTIPEPEVKEIEVPTPVYKHVVEKVPLTPACQNHLGFPVPCH